MTGSEFDTRKPSSYASIESHPAGAQRPIDLREGIQPWRYNPALDRLETELIESGLARLARGTYYEEDMTPAHDNLRERLGLGSESHIIFTPYGADLLFREIAYQMESDSIVWGYSPHFPDFLLQLNPRIKRGEIKYRTHPISMNKSYDEALWKDLLTLEQEYEFYKRGEHPLPPGGFPPTHIYLQNADFKGDIASREIIEETIKFWEGVWEDEDQKQKEQRKKKGKGKTKEIERLIILDEATLPTSESMADLTAAHKNLVVVRSLSKINGLPGDDMGYMISHKSFGRKFEANLPNHFLRGRKRIYFNEIFSPNGFAFEDDISNLIFKRKIKLEEELIKRKIKFLPTSHKSFFLVVDGDFEGFVKAAEEMDLLLANALGFFDVSYPQVSETNPELTTLQLSARYGRVLIPENEDDIPEVAKRIEAAINIGRANGLI
jgi:hypothetical protein